MTNDIFGTMCKLGKANYVGLQELYNINLKIADQISDQQQAFVNLSIDCATSQMEILSKSKDYKAVVNAQATLIKDTNEKVQGIARNTVDIINESKDEVSAWVEKGVEDMVPFTKKAA